MTAGIQPMATGVNVQTGPTYGMALGQFTWHARGRSQIRSAHIDSVTPWADVVACVAAIGVVHVELHDGASRFAVVEVADTVALLDGNETWGEYAVTVAADNATHADNALAALRELIPARPAVEDATVDIHFWMEHPMMGAVAQRRAVDRLHWADVAGNYPTAVRSQLDHLISLTTAPAAGRLMVFHGEPGTGKTRFIQALAGEWADWCTVQYIVDPDKMLDSAFYLNTVMAGDDHPDDGRWRLVVIEDGDEFIDTDAKARSGHAIARLLNLADGLVGQGLKVMVAVSTNVPEASFAGAVVRTGRCGALVEFPRFTVTEAVEWCAARGATDADFEQPPTLAELYAQSR